MSHGESDMDTPTSDCGWRRGGGLRARPGPTGAPAGTGSSSRALRTSRRPHFRHFPGNSFHVGVSHTRPACGSMRTGGAPRPPPQPRRGVSPGCGQAPTGARRADVCRRPLRLVLPHVAHVESRGRRGFSHAHSASVPSLAWPVDPLRDHGPNASTRPPAAGDPSRVLSASCVVPAPSPAPHGRDASAPACTPAPRSHTGFHGEVPTRSVKSAPKRLFAFYFDAIVVRVLDFIFHVFAARVQKSNDHLSDFRSRERPGPTRYSVVVVVFFQLLLLYGLPRDDGVNKDGFAFSCQLRGIRDFAALRCCWALIATLGEVLRTPALA